MTVDLLVDLRCTWSITICGTMWEGGSRFVQPVHPRHVFRYLAWVCVHKTIKHMPGHKHRSHAAACAQLPAVQLSSCRAPMLQLIRYRPGGTSWMVLDRVLVVSSSKQAAGTCQSMTRAPYMGRACHKLEQRRTAATEPCVAAPPNIIPHQRHMPTWHCQVPMVHVQSGSPQPTGL